MKLSDCINMALTDLKKRKFRTFLTAFGISIGTMLIILMFGLGEGLQKIALDQFKQNDTIRVMTVYPNMDKEKNKINKKIDKDVISKIKGINGVTSVIPSVDAKVTSAVLNGKDAKKVNIKGLDYNYDIFTEAEKTTVKGTKTKNKTNKKSDEYIVAGKLVSKEDKNKFLIGENILKKMKITDYNTVIDKEIELRVELPQMEGMPQVEPLVIKGIVSGVINANYKDSKGLIVPVDTVAQIQQYYTGDKEYLNKNGYSSIEVQAKNFETVKSVEASIKNIGVEVSSQVGYTDAIKTQFNMLKGIFAIAGVIVLLVSSIGVINTMNMAVSEKTKSIGIMKAQGASKSNITTMFTVQSGVVGFIGGIMGTVISVVLSIVINNVLVKQIAKKGIEDVSTVITSPLWVMLAAIGFGVVVSMIAGVVPARKAAKLDPVESLRYE